MAEIIALSRRLFERNNEMHDGKYHPGPVPDAACPEHMYAPPRKLRVSRGLAPAQFWTECHEIRGKTLGIIGYGHIGSQLSVLAEAMGMRVQFYDIIPLMPLGTARAVPTCEVRLRVKGRGGGWRAGLIRVAVNGEVGDRSCCGRRTL